MDLQMGAACRWVQKSSWLYFTGSKIFTCLDPLVQLLWYFKWRKTIIIQRTRILLESLFIFLFSSLPFLLPLLSSLLFLFRFLSSLFCVRNPFNVDAEWGMPWDGVSWPGRLSQTWSQEETLGGGGRPSHTKGSKRRMARAGKPTRGPVGQPLRRYLS